MDVNTEFYTYWTMVLIAFIISIVYFRRLDLPLKFISFLLGFDLISEMSAHYAAVQYHNNMAVYHVSVPVTALLISLYYNYAVPVFRQYRIGWLMAFAGILFSVYNTIMLQPLNTFNNNAFMYLACSTVGMALFTFVRIFMAADAGRALWKDVHFLLSLVLMFYWSGTIVVWSVLGTIEQQYVPSVFLLVWVVNMLTYMSIGWIMIACLHCCAWRRKLTYLSILSSMHISMT
jgi:hypothetical protein